MGADIHKIGVLDLCSEGEAVLLLESWKKPSTKDINKMEINGEKAKPLFHYPYCGGEMKFIKITDARQVLRCERCGLRIRFDNQNLQTVHDLQK